MKKLDKWLSHFENALIVVTFAVMIIMVTIQIFTRYFKLGSIFWTEEVAKYAMVWLVFIAASSGFKKGSHIGVDVFVQILPKRAATAVKFAILCLVFVLLLILTFVATQYVISSTKTPMSSPTLGVPMYYIYLAMPIGFLCSAIREFMNIVNLIREIRRKKGDL